MAAAQFRERGQAQAQPRKREQGVWAQDERAWSDP